MNRRKKRKGRKKDNNLITLYRWLFSILIGIILFYLAENHTLEEVKPGEAPVLYANACHDDLEKLYVEAVENAHHSVLLVIYSLSDSKLIRALNCQAEKGVKVTVIHDRSTPAAGFQKLYGSIRTERVERSGLMHQKILVIDSSKVLLGSANMTTESLRMHDNLVVGLINEQLAKVIEREISYASLTSGGQNIEYWDLPHEGKEALQRIIRLIDGAKKTVRVAMYTWTHCDLAEAVIRAHKRGVDVEVVLDRGQAQGVCQKTVNHLLRGGVEPCLSSGLGLLHHKFAWIDGECLINGSANWTQSAFTRNRDCFLILHKLTEEQNAKLEALWKKIYSSVMSEKLDIAA